MLGSRLKKLRIEKKLTQEELGKIVNVTKVSISGYENGNRNPDTETLENLADFFEVSVDYLLGRTDQLKPIESDIDIEPELEEFMKDLNVWYKNEPEAEKDIEVFRRIMNSYKNDKK